MLDYFTIVFQEVDVSFPISVIAMAIPGRSSRRAHNGSFTVWSEKRKRILFFVFTQMQETWKGK